MCCFHSSFGYASASVPAAHVHTNLTLIRTGPKNSGTPLGRTWQLESQVSRGKRQEQSEGPTLDACLSSLGSAQHHLTQSVTLLRQSGQQHELPRGLLHRAALWREMLELGTDSPAREEGGSDATAAGKGIARDALSEPSARLSQRESELLARADKDLSEAETIAERGSMLIWQIEAALERARLYLALSSVNSVSLRFKTEELNTETQRTQSDWLTMAREQLAEAMQLVKQTERPYEPHKPMDEIWDGDKKWEPPEYVGVFKKGEIVGYHCRKDEIARLQRELQE